MPHETTPANDAQRPRPRLAPRAPRAPNPRGKFSAPQAFENPQNAEGISILSRTSGGKNLSRDRTRKDEKSFRETPKPLKSPKTAKSGLFGIERYQGLSKAQDFAGE